MARGPIVLLTDFGESEYAGVMKGVLARSAPGAAVIDLTHDLRGQAVREGAWVLAQSFSWFPSGAVFLCVVDPGVGTERRAVAVQTRSYWFVGPDNGLLHPAVSRDGMVAAVELQAPPGASRTFHGRDLFAPAAARLAAGEPLTALGEGIDELIPLTFHREGREGEVVRIDRFGNCITNLPPLPNRSEYEAWIERGRLPAVLPFFSTYGRAPSGRLFVVENAYGTLEIACKNESAQARVKTGVGGRVRLA